VIETDDGQTVHLPNSKVLSSPIVNRSTLAARRTEVEVRSAGSDDIDATVHALLEATNNVSGVHTDPVPEVFVRGVEPARLTTVVRFWHDASAGATVASDVVRAIADAQRRRGVSSAVITPPPATTFTPPEASLDAP
jgi:small-conductance mechanosensitive channel